jgi:hypothetical protein
VCVCVRVCVCVCVPPLLLEFGLDIFKVGSNFA